MEDIDEMKTTRVLRAVPSRRASAAAAIAKSNRLDKKCPLNDDSDSLSDSSEVSVIERITCKVELLTERSVSDCTKIGPKINKNPKEMFVEILKVLLQF